MTMLHHLLPQNRHYSGFHHIHSQNKFFYFSQKLSKT